MLADLGLVDSGFGGWWHSVARRPLPHSLIDIWYRLHSSEFAVCVAGVIVVAVVPYFFLFCWLLFTYLYYCFVLAVDLWRVVGDSSSSSSSASATAVAVADIEAPKTHSTMPGICPRCTKNVYFAEEKIALGKSFHKMCFQCGTPLWRWSASVSLRATCHSCHSCHVQWLPELESAVMIASCCRLLDAPVEMRLTCAIYITCIWYIYIWYIWYCSGGDIGFNGRKWNLNCQVDYSCYVTEREGGVGGGRGADATVSNWQPIRCVDFWNVLRQERMNKCHACGASSSWPYYQCRFDETGRQLSEIDSSRWSLASVARTHTHTHIHLYNFFLGRLFRYFWFCFVLFLLIFFTNFLKILNSIIFIIIINIIFLITICMYNNMIFYDFYCIIYDTYITIFFKMVIVIAIWFVCMFVWLNWIVVSFFFGCRDVSSSQL